MNNNGIQNHFTGGCYWLTVGNSKTSIPNLLRELRRKMVGRPPTSGDDDIKSDLFRDLKDRERMLLVLDDVWKTETLEILDVMPKGGGCKVLITTRNEDVLNRKHATKFKMPMLPPEDSWELFRHHAWCGDSNMPLGLEEVGREITSRCGGLPLALKVIGGHLAGRSDPSYWERTLEKVKNADAVSSDESEQLCAKLELSVDELDKVHPRLKDGFFYFAAFPEDFEVELERDLFRLWLGDGIVGVDAKYDPMGEAEDMLDKLVQLSLIEVHNKESGYFFPAISEGKVFVVHDVLRDLIRHLLQRVPLERRECLFEAGLDLGFLPGEYHPVSSRGGVTLSSRRLSLMSSKVVELPPKLVDAPKLQVMILRDNPIFAIPTGFFGDNFRDLRVLDLSYTRIGRLRKGLGKLKHLVVLNLEGSSVERLSYKFIGAVTKLRVLNVRGCDNLKYLPSSISSLSMLQYLETRQSSLFSSDAKWYERRRGSLTDLMKLFALKELRISGGSRKNLPDGIFKELKCLRVLNLEYFENLVAIPEVGSDELQNLQELSLRECMSLTSCPDSFGNVLKNLHSLKLRRCFNLKVLPNGLGSFGKLKYLDLRGSGVLLCFRDYLNKPDTFPVLKELHLGGLFGFQRLSLSDLQPDAMPRLEFLDLVGLEEVDFPKPIANLTKLRFLYLRGGMLRSLERDGVGVQNLANLEVLDVSGSAGLSKLPDGLEKSPKLRRIVISGSSITSVSQELSHLVSRR